MIDTNTIRRNVLDLAIKGKLTQPSICDENANTLYKKIVDERRAQKEKFTDDVYDPPFLIPETWRWVKIGNIASVFGGKRIPAGRSLTTEDTGQKYIRVSDMKKRSVELDNLLYVPEDIIDSISRYTIRKEDVYITVAGTIGKVGKIPEEIDGANLTENADRLVFRHVNQDWLIYCLESEVVQKQIRQLTTQVAQPKLAIKRIQEFVVPMPPILEQTEISCKIDAVFEALDTIDELQSAYSSDLEVLKSKIIDAGIQGKLTEQLPEDGNAEDLYAAIQEDIDEDEKILPIPDNWQWIKLGWAMDIERGGSPRPIKAFMTDDEDGINWIKIGDVAKDGKYITQTKEKIKPEGEKKSRKVVPGDFLLTNSMSFGRPYISKIYGCIHDGWLLLRNSKGAFDLDYLYYLLSSKYAYDQFRKKASGATVDNLNKEKVASAVIPLPPISEQIRIAEIIEKTLSMI